MSYSARAASKTFSLALSLSLAFPQALLAQGARSSRAPAPAPPAVPLASVALPLSAGFLAPIGSADSAVAGLSGPILAPLTAAPQAVPVLPAAVQSVPAHPVLGVIEALQAKGVSLSEPVTNADAQALAAAAQGLPPGAVRASLMAIAQSVAAPSGGGLAADAGARLGQAYEGSAAGAGAASAVRLGGGLLARMSRWAFLPSPLRRAFAHRAAAKDQPRDPALFEVPPAGLRWVPAPESLPESTGDIRVETQRIVGQDEALKAIRFGVTMPGKGYNLYVSGPDGSGRETAVKDTLDELAPKEATPPDLVAATNFQNPDQPVILEAPAGTGAKLGQAAGAFVQSLKRIVPEAMNAPQIRGMKKTIESSFESLVQSRIAVLRKEVEAVRFQDGKFGMTLLVAQGEEEPELHFPLTYRAADGTMKSVTSVEQKAKLVEDGVFTEAEWEEALRESIPAEKPFREKFMEMHAANEAEYAEVQAKLQMLDRQIAAQAISEEGENLLKALGSLTHNADTPEHKAWEARVQKRMAAVQAEFQKARAGKIGIALLRMGPMIVPALAEERDGEMVPLTKEEVDAKVAAGEVTSDEISKLMKKGAELVKLLQAAQRKAAEEHDALHAAEKASNPGQDGLLEGVLAYFQGLVQHAAANYQVFLPRKVDEKDPLSVLRAGFDPADAFRFSVLASNRPGSGAPVVWDRSPSVEGTFGTAEGNGRSMPMLGVRMKDPGGPTIKGGLFPKARGGFYVVDVMDALRAPGFWPILMRAVRNEEVEIAEDGLLGLLRMSGDRYRIPAKVKVILVGPPIIKMLLQHYDDDFARNFNASVEFEPSLPVGESAVSGYLQFMRQVIVKSGGRLLDATRDGMSALLEYAGRLVDSNRKLTAQFGEIYTLMREASFAARAAGRSEVGREDVDAALKTRADREGGFQKRYMERLIDRTFVVETDGERVGQINGLAVMGNFGSAMRITVAATAGKPGLVSVDRDARMTGQSFEKALGVVEGFLQNTFAQKKPISANIRISFEQSYGGIDGDSATSTEIYGSLSSLSGIPIRQGIAVTGSADQFGNVQAIGGVNEKIEGFFDLAAARGLNGAQGVMIPKANVSNLMLKPEIVQAVREGKFHIWAVDHVSQGIEILTGQAYSQVLLKAEARLEELRGGGKK